MGKAALLVSGQNSCRRPAVSAGRHFPGSLADSALPVYNSGFLHPSGPRRRPEDPGCYMYITPVEAPPGEVIQQKAQLFGQRVPYTFQNYERQWKEWLDKFHKLGKEMEAIQIPEKLYTFVPESEVIPSPKGYTDANILMENFNNIINLIFRAWQYHFQYLNLAYLAYLMFVDTARKLFPNIKEGTIGKMVAGADVSMFRPEEELCRLSRLAVASRAVGANPQGEVERGGQDEGLEGHRRGQSMAGGTRKGQESMVLCLLRQRLVPLRGKLDQHDGPAVQLHAELCRTARERRENRAGTRQHPRRKGNGSSPSTGH